ncbi:uncharacterized protein LOC120534678 [Polypterus senegalus]|uniref:uncharacterized protein LOC120534678 n=1 Tax=Polypterus senegalus TaxID=55291 RepID=UPI0019658ED8|nr:uncharacterized protein LOC120534678 [Polypterus senegalus]
MLVKVNYLQVKKYIKLQDGFTFEEFLNEDLIIKISPPSTCTDPLSNSSDVEGLERTKLNPSASSNFNNGREITSAEKAKQIVQNALKQKPVGLDVLEEYELTKTLKHSTRRQLVNVLVSHMTEVHGRIPTLKQRETYALGIVSLFPALRDPYSSKGYLNQDFILLFNAETSAKLLEQWEMAFKPKVIEEAKSLTLTAELQSHISAAEKQQSEHEWDSDISSFLLLLHLLPPSAGRKKVKISPTDAVDRLVHFQKVNYNVGSIIYAKTDFSKVLWTDEMRVSLDGPDGWARGWIGKGQRAPVRLRRQQGGGGVLVWAGIVKDELVGPFRVEDGVKLNSQSYCQFLEDTFFKQWYRKKSASFKKNMIFMQDNAPSHASKYSTAWLARKGIKEEKLMTWPSCSPDLNPIENLWSIIKYEIYKEGKQYTSLNSVWEAVVMVNRSKH